MFGYSRSVGWHKNFVDIIPEICLWNIKMHILEKKMYIDIGNLI